MQHPAFQSTMRFIVFAVICLLTGMALLWAEYGLLPIPMDVLIWDSIIHAMVFGLLAYLLWFVVQFADLSTTAPYQILINHVALVVILVLAWVGIPVFFERIIWSDHWDLLNQLIRIKTVFGLLLMLLLLLGQKHLKQMALDELDDDDETVATPIQSLRNLENQRTNSSPLQAISNGALQEPTLQALVQPVTLKQAPTRELLTTVSVKTGQKIQMISMSDVLYFQAEGDYVLIQTVDGRFLKEQTMKYFEENLSPESFVRIHRSCIVHVEFISRIELYEKQNYRITLKTGHQLKASQTGYRLLKQTLKL